MCGIVGVLGKHEAAPLLVEALKRLEYRGYDSAGIATVNDGKLERRRAIGKLVNLSDLLVHNPLAGKSGIGHTRWATHGAPSVKNAHPHQAGDVTVVHNGIIENYLQLKQQLMQWGHHFDSSTDSEVVPHLINHYLAQQMSQEEAIEKTITQLKGSYALGILINGTSNNLYAIKQGSPLVISQGNLNFLIFKILDLDFS